MPNTLPDSGSLYIAVWRWHFVAGLLVLPVMVLLAITGGAYLFKPEIDHFVYRAMQDVPARAAAFAPPSRVIERVEARLHARVLVFTPPTVRDRAARLLVRGPTDTALTVFADPYDGRVTGWTEYGGIMQVVRKIHSLQLFGFWASSIIEVAAGWCIVLVGTGVFLWWPRKSGPGGVPTRRGGVLSLRWSPGGRVFWRDLHAVTGVLAGGIILFLAATGMPWSMFWGAHVQSWATASSLNVPPPPAAVTPEWLMTASMPKMPHAPHAPPGDPAAKETMPWAMERMQMPESRQPSAKDPIDVDRAAVIFGQLGLDPGASITLPEGDKGAYVGTWRPDRVQDSRVVYLDQYTGGVLGDVRFKDWGFVGKGIEWGIAVHQGQEYGAFNRYLMLAGCVAILVMAVAAVTMWWKRRPAGSWGMPPAPKQRRATRSLLAIMAAVGAIFPLVGASLLVVLGIEVVVRALAGSSTART